MGNKCELCGNVRKLEVHHLNYGQLGRERLSNLKVLCKKCHMQEHSLLPDEDQLHAESHIQSILLEC